MRFPPLPCLLLPALVLAGCASAPRLYVEAAPQPAACSRFAWFMPGDEPETFVDQRMRAEVMQGLAAKGYIVDDPEPDCLVAYRLVTETRYRPGPSVGVGMGGGSGRVGGGVGVNVPVGESSSASGRLSLDVIDAARNAQVWSGTLDKATRSAQPTVEEIRAAVAQILAAYPDR
jgi:hypothetical protein